MGKAVKLPKTECCVSKTRCNRCPIRMLQEGTLPEGFGVHKRKLVRVDKKGRRKRAKKSQIAAAMVVSGKSRKKAA